MSKKFISLLFVEYLENGLYSIISEIPLDVRKSSTYSFKSKITEFPVDDGSQITDNRNVLPDEISLEGFVSDSPLTTIASNNLGLKGDASALVGANSVTQGAYDALIDIHRNNKFLMVVTEYATFEDMAIEELEIPRDAEKGLGFYFSLKLKQVKIVQNQTAALSKEVVARLRKKSQKASKGLTKLQRKLADQLTAEAIKNKGRLNTAEAEAKIKAAGDQKYLDTLGAGYFAR
jgi:hypothetical protein